MRTREVKPFGTKFAAVLMLIDGRSAAEVADKHGTTSKNVREWEENMAPMIEYIRGLNRDIEVLTERANAPKKTDTRLETLNMVFKAMPRSDTRTQVLGKMAEAILEAGEN